MDQGVLDEAVKIATSAAMHGHPVKRIVWLPPTTVTADPRGVFIVTPCGPLNATDRPPWW